MDVFYLYLFFWGDGIYVVYLFVEFYDCFVVDCYIFVFGFLVVCYMVFCLFCQFGDSFQVFYFIGGLDDKFYGIVQYVVVL